MARRRRHRKRRENCWPMIAAAFGAGLILALCFSLKLALFLAAVTLIYVGLTSC